MENLEIVTNRDNSNQKHIKSSSGYVGVSFAKDRNMWRSTIYIDGRNISIGYFKKEIDAAIAYQKALANHLSITNKITV